MDATAVVIQPTTSSNEAATHGERRPSWIVSGRARRERHRAASPAIARYASSTLSRTDVTISDAPAVQRLLIRSRERSRHERVECVARLPLACARETMQPRALNAVDHPARWMRVDRRRETPVQPAELVVAYEDVDEPGRTHGVADRRELVGQFAALPDPSAGDQAAPTAQRRTKKVLLGARVDGRQVSDEVRSFGNPTATISSSVSAALGSSRVTRQRRRRRSRRR